MGKVGDLGETFFWGNKVLFVAGYAFYPEETLGGKTWFLQWSLRCRFEIIMLSEGKERALFLF